MNYIEQLRSRTLHHLLSIDSVNNEWTVRCDAIRKAISNIAHPSAEDVVGLGSHLAEMFQCTGSGDRSQSALSGGGKVWEVLVLWYLNLCYAGTHAVAVTGKFIPKCVRDALRVNYDNRSVKSDTDVVVLSHPGLLECPQKKLGETKLFEAIDSLVGKDFERTGVTVIQTKTHWNDSAQTPMLWNIIYRQARLGRIVENGFGIGSGLWSVQNLGDFAYAFATVPSNSAGLKYSPDQVPVLRVKGMTGGAYWGRETKKGVCWSMGEFFIKQFTRNGNIWPNVKDIGKGFGKALSGDASIDAAAFRFP